MENKNREKNSIVRQTKIAHIDVVERAMLNELLLCAVFYTNNAVLSYVSNRKCHLESLMVVFANLYLSHIYLRSIFTSLKLDFYLLILSYAISIEIIVGRFDSKKKTTKLRARESGRAREREIVAKFNHIAN